MLISAIQKFTVLDYPNHTACIVFTPGCNFRCGYCHNPEFVLPEMLTELKQSFIDEESFFSFLEQRRKKLDGVVVTGGEPTVMPDLIPFLKKIKRKKFLVKLDTNGNNPHILERILEEKCADYVAMDIKISLPEYKKLVGPLVDELKITKSIDLLQRLAPDYEFRSTLIQEIHTPQILEAMATMVHGAKKLYLQNFRPGHTLHPLYQTFHPLSEQEMLDAKKIFGQTVESVDVRT